MGKKRKSISAGVVDEIDRNMYSTFSSAASSLSQLYTQAMNHQKLSFHAGQRHSVEKLYQWILRHQEAGARVTTADILTYLQSELNNSGDELSMSPRAPVQHNNPQAPAHFTNSGFLVTGSSQTPTTQTPRTEQENQAKNLVFSNALSSPLRHSVQHYHIAHSNGVTPAGLQNRDSNSNDSSMDMHQDSPGPESNY